MKEVTNKELTYNEIDITYSGLYDDIDNIKFNCDITFDIIVENTGDLSISVDKIENPVLQYQSTTYDDNEEEIYDDVIKNLNQYQSSINLDNYTKYNESNILFRLDTVEIDLNSETIVYNFIY